MSQEDPERKTLTLAESRFKKEYETRDQLQPTVFIPEAYCTHKEIIQELPGYGWGIVIPANKMADAIRSGRVAASVLAHRAFITIIHETAIEPGV